MWCGNQNDDKDQEVPYGLIQKCWMHLNILRTANSHQMLVDPCKVCVCLFEAEKFIEAAQDLEITFGNHIAGTKSTL